MLSQQIREFNIIEPQEKTENSEVSFLKQGCRLKNLVSTDPQKAVWYVADTSGFQAAFCSWISYIKMSSMWSIYPYILTYGGIKIY